MQILLIQLDGLAHPHFQQAIDEGLLPHLAKRIEQGEFGLQRAQVPLPSGTLAFQKGLFYGSREPFPGTRWWDRQERRLSDATQGRSLARLEQNLEQEHRTLFQQGSSFGGQLGGRSGRLELSLSGWGRSRSNTLQVLRKVRLSTWWAALNKGFRHWAKESKARMGKGQKGRYAPLQHALVGPFALEILCDLAHQELQAGSALVFLNCFGHDSLCHHLGPLSPLVREHLRHIDEKVEQLLQWAQTQSSPVQVLLFSDHGQASSRPFQDVYLQKPEVFIQDLARVLARDPSLPLRMVSSGNVAHLYADSENALTESGLEERFPGLTRVLARHPAVGLVAAREEGEQMSLSHGANRVRLAPGQAPPARLGLGEQGPEITQRIRELVFQKDSGDLILFGGKVDGRVISFLNQWGCHNGYLSPQREAFVLVPSHLEFNVSPEHPALSLREFVLSLFETFSNQQEPSRLTDQAQSAGVT